MSHVHHQHRPGAWRARAGPPAVGQHLVLAQQPVHRRLARDVDAAVRQQGHHLLGGQVPVLLAVGQLQHPLALGRGERVARRGTGACPAVLLRPWRTPALHRAGADAQLRAEGLQPGALGQPGVDGGEHHFSRPSSVPSSPSFHPGSWSFFGTPAAPRPRPGTSPCAAVPSPTPSPACWPPSACASPLPWPAPRGPPPRCPALRRPRHATHATAPRAAPPAAATPRAPSPTAPRPPPRREVSLPPSTSSGIRRGAWTRSVRSSPRRCLPPATTSTMSAATRPPASPTCVRSPPTGQPSSSPSAP